MTSAYYYNQQPGVSVPPVPQQRGIPGQIGINPAQGHYIQQQQQQYRNQNMSDPNAHRKRAHSKPSRQSAPLVDDADEPSGDELDDISARDIAMARYKRNHDYLSEIFTPYNAASIIPPPLDITQTKEELDKQIEEYKERKVRQKKTHEERMILLEKEQEQYWKLMNKLNEATTIESIEEASNELAKEIGVKIEHSTSNVKVLAIPGIEDEDLLDLEKEKEIGQQNEEENQMEEIIENKKSESPNNNDLIGAGGAENTVNNNTTNSGDNNNNNSSNNNVDGEDDMDMFFNDQQQEGENTDSFFNEMVNTDDDPSVNEFLNTE